MALEQWAPRALEQAGDNATKTIQLHSEGVIFETWSAPFPPADEWLAQARAVMESIASESPKGKRVPLMFTAVGATSGEITTQSATSVTGKNAAADTMIGSGGATAKAFADAFVGIVATMNAVNKAAKEMVENVTAANKALTEQIVDLREFAEAVQDQALVSKKQDASVNEYLTQQLKDASPLILEAFGLWLEGAKSKPLATAGKAVAGIINGSPAINGASS
jgi:hypothetical protein